MKTTAYIFLILLSILFAACRRTVLRKNIKTDSVVTRSYEMTGDWERLTIREYTLEPNVDLPEIPNYLSSFQPDSGFGQLVAGAATTIIRKQPGRWRIRESIQEKGTIKAKGNEKTEVKTKIKSRQKESGLAKCTWWVWVFFILIIVAIVLLYFRFRDINKHKI